jgi:hypothetical protein
MALRTTRELGFRVLQSFKDQKVLTIQDDYIQLTFFELVDQPVQVQFALSEAESEQLFTHLNQEDVRIFM